MEKPVIRRHLQTPVLAALLCIGMVFLGAQAFIRLSPNDPARWHIDPSAAGFAPAANWAAYCPAIGPAATPAALALLDATILATPRTRRLAGSPEQGRTTYITRSALMGYPDFTTVTLRATPAGLQPCLVARARFGDYDWGVNTARVSRWAQAAFHLPAPPPRLWN